MRRIPGVVIIAILASLSSAAEATIIAQHDYFSVGGTAYPDPFYADYRIMQTFVATQTGTVTSVDVTIDQMNTSTTAALTANIFALTMSTFNGLQPTGASLSTGQLPASDTQFDTNYTWKNIPMSAVQLTAGVSYGLVLDAEFTNWQYRWNYRDGGAGYPSGDASIAYGYGTFAHQSYDEPFRINAVVPEPGSLGLVIVGAGAVLLRRRS